MIEISKENARDFLVNYQGLSDFGQFEGYEGAKHFMERVRCIQYDPLDVVGRNPDLVLQSRVKNYRPQMLYDLLYKERFLVDGFDKVVSIILMEDYPGMARVRKATTDSLVGILANRGSSEALNMLDETVAYVRENGPLPANKINIGGRAEKGGWGHGKLSSAALDYLFHDGRIGIHSKQKAQRVYDLSERLYKPEILIAPDPFTDEDAFLRWYIKRRIGSIGMVWNRNTGAWLWHFLYNRHPREEIIRELVSDGELIELRVEGSKEPFYIRREEEGLLGKPSKNATAQFIAPLDNLIWDRGITEQVFDFKYSWEVYTPVAKRQYGYYVLPVLYGNRFIARFEPEKNNGKDPLRIKNWWWEKDVVVTDTMLEAIGDAFRRFSEYLGVPVTDVREWKETYGRKETF